MRVRTALALVAIILITSWTSLTRGDAPSAHATVTTTRVLLDAVPTTPGVQDRANYLQGAPIVQVDVRIEDAASIGSYDLELHFGASPLDFTSWANGPFLGSTGRFPSCFQFPTPVSVDLGCTTFGALPPGPSGSGLLATLYFSATGVGESCILVLSVGTATVNGDALPTIGERACIRVFPATATSCLNPLLPATGDSDSDALLNNAEATYTTDPCDPDSDNDTLLDGYEAARACLNPLLPDAAGDPDGDTLLSGTESNLGSNPCSNDTDSDTMLDNYELARPCLNLLTNDGAGDPDADALASAAEAAIGADPCDPDTDGDTLLDGYEAQHACLDVIAPDPAGGDPDVDTLTNALEFAVGTDPCTGDTDSDALPDAYEVAHACLSATTDDAAADPDTDALGNLDEFAAGADPCDGDTDDDAMGDGYEAPRVCLDALVADALADADNDTLTNIDEHARTTDPCLADTDTDGCTDGQEVGPAALMGGLRDPLNRWDFYDVNGSRNVNAADIALVRVRAFTSPVPPEDEIYDRSAGTAPWAPGPPNGAINAADISFVRVSFGHSCLPA
jgi:hypothetical protein